MVRPRSQHPTELELEILKILWRDGPACVRRVRDGLSGFRELAYTSVMTVMNIMMKKAYLKRSREGRLFVYRPLVSESGRAGPLRPLHRFLCLMTEKFRRPITPR